MTRSQMLPSNFRFDEQGILLGIAQLRYPEDLLLVHGWMNQPYVAAQWKLALSVPDLAVYLEKALADDHQRLYILTLNQSPIGYVEIYEAARDRLARYVKTEPDDMGYHLLIGEPEAVGKGLLRSIIRLLTHFIFRHSAAQRLLGEPDSQVPAYAAVARDVHYEARGLLRMPEKTATFFVCERATFYRSITGNQEAIA